jgi:hypothetical protein
VPRGAVLQPMYSIAVRKPRTCIVTQLWHWIIVDFVGVQTVFFTDLLAFFFFILCRNLVELNEIPHDIPWLISLFVHCLPWKVDRQTGPRSRAAPMATQQTKAKFDVWRWEKLEHIYVSALENSFRNK